MIKILVLFVLLASCGTDPCEELKDICDQCLTEAFQDACYGAVQDKNCQETLDVGTFDLCSVGRE
jgi:hypothetical protein